MDELDFPGFSAPDPRRAHIVVECMTQGSHDLLLYACSPRVVPCPTAKQDARRLVRMLRFPIISIMSVVSLNWRSASKIYAGTLTCTARTWGGVLVGLLVRTASCVLVGMLVHTASCVLVGLLVRTASCVWCTCPCNGRGL